MGRAHPRSILILYHEAIRRCDIQLSVIYLKTGIGLQAAAIQEKGAAVKYHLAATVEKRRQNIPVPIINIRTKSLCIIRIQCAVAAPYQ